MIGCALVVPSTPMILPEYVGLADPVAEIRARAVAAIRAELAPDGRPGSGAVERVLVVAAGERAPRHTKGALAARVARRLLEEAGWAGPVVEIGLPLDASAAEVAAVAAAVREAPGRVLVLVPADGSARRTEKAPGHVDPRAAAVDDSLLSALGAGDGEALMRLDPVLCEELWLTGRAPLQVLAASFAGMPIAAELIWSGDPFGVLYVIAAWRMG